MSSKKVVYAKTQTNIFTPGAGDLGTVFPPQGKTLAGLEMGLNENDSLVLTFKYGAKNHSLTIPAANIVVASTVSDAPAATNLKAVG